ncbi:MAG: glutamate 5-kinase [Pseudomonadota bacterium]|nr:glutamate 5-kinase [Pseudomonadota bacterium]
MAALTAIAPLTGTARLTGARRLVLKIGSALLVDPATGDVRRDWLDALARDIAAARARGQDVAIVSSGAVALGRRRIGISRSRPKLEEKQAAAAIGQIRLARAWQEALERHGLTCGQILVTFGATENRRQYLNARSTLDTLFRLGAIPVINENDTVATLEIRYGDNDRLAARVAQMISADCLVLFSDVAGLYTADPRSDPEARLVEEIGAVDERIMAMASGPISGVGSGGMTTKLQAAAIAVAAGCHMVIADGRVAHPLSRIEAGEPCSWFVAQHTPRTARKQWIATMLKPAGTLVVDAGAVRALNQGRSLLPAGVRRVEGSFDRGDPVQVQDEQGRAVARGLIAYDAADAGRIAGHRSGDIADLLGYRGRDEMIHRDDLVLDDQEAGEGMQS